MYVKDIENTPSFQNRGNKYHMLLPRDITECSEAALVRIEKAKSTPSHIHSDEEQVYFILEGKGWMKIDDEETEVQDGMVVFVPRNARHEIACTSEEDLVYIYVGAWPEGVPEGRKSWKRAYHLE